MGGREVNSDFGGPGGAGFGGGGGGAEGNSDRGGGGGGGGSWATANTTYDPTAPTSAPDAPNSTNTSVAGAVQIVYTTSCGTAGSCTLCPSGTTSVSVQGGAVSCVLETSAAYDVGTWLESAIGAGLILPDQELRLTAWGGAGGTAGAHQTSGGLASLATTRPIFSMRRARSTSTSATRAAAETAAASPAAAPRRWSSPGGSSAP